VNARIAVAMNSVAKGTDIATCGRISAA